MNEVIIYIAIAIIIIAIIIFIVLFTSGSTNSPHDHIHEEGERHIHLPGERHVHESDTFDSTWTNISGFSGDPTNKKIIYSRVGNVVTCAGWFDFPVASAGANIAEITLPIARKTDFSINHECIGVVNSTDNRLNTGFVVAKGGTTNVALVNINITAGGGATITCNFQYLLS